MEPLPTNALHDTERVPPSECVVAKSGFQAAPAKVAASTFTSAQLGANLELDTDLTAEVGTQAVTRSTKELHYTG
jgi:hypothetical protein